MVNEAHEHDLDVTAAAQIERAEQRLFGLTETGQAVGGPQPVAKHGRDALDRIEAAYKRDRRVIGVATGFPDLDRRIGGLRPGSLIIVGARPSMGKTALATNIAVDAARSGTRVGFFSLEMSAADLTTRLIAQRAGIPANALFTGAVDAKAFDSIVAAESEVAKLPIEIDATGDLTIAAMRSRARRLKRRGGLGLIVVDYLQLMQPNDRRRNGNRVEEVSEISRGLKSIALGLDVPVLALSQLSRAVEGREDKRPQLADLRETGSIEQDADIVMFIFREEYYLGRRDPDILKPHERELLEKSRGTAEIIVEKSRNGPIGTTKLHYDAELISFGSLTRAEVR